MLQGCGEYGPRFGSANLWLPQVDPEGSREVFVTSEVLCLPEVFVLLVGS